MKRIPFDAGCQYFSNETLSVSLQAFLALLDEKSGKNLRLGSPVSHYLRPLPRVSSGTARCVSSVGHGAGKGKVSDPKTLEK